MSKRRIAVITARADDNEQKTILTGIAQAALSLDADVTVFTNIYNHWVIDDVLNFENIIYDLVSPEIFDGIIITAEAFMDLSVLDDLISKIKKSRIPAVVIGGEIKGFKSIYSDDKSDMEQIAEHLITVHGFTDMHIITGGKDNAVSKARLNGCKKAFEKHDVPLDKSKIHYGNFWTDSGEALAEKYISGEIPMPQAVICTNDFMAYGLCDRLSAAGINIPEEITVTGYDYNEGRIYHFPLLTTFQRNRRKMGIDAVNYLLGTNYTEQTDSRFIYGNSCTCGAERMQTQNEIYGARIGQYHITMNSVAQFSSRLTLCRTLSEYNETLSEFFYLLHGINKLYICIDKSWNNEVLSENEYICCEISATGTVPFVDKLNRSELLTRLCDSDEKKLLFYLPLVFQKKSYGFIVLFYDYPDCYDTGLRDFIKTAVNSLEFLRMKNDIHYLSQCQRESSLHDSLTGFYNLREFKEIVKIMGNGENINLLSIGIIFSANGEYIYGENYQSNIMVAAAFAIKKICTNHEVCCRNGNRFIILHREGCCSDKLAATLKCELNEKFNDNRAELYFAEIVSDNCENAIDNVIFAAEKQEKNSRQTLLRRQGLPHYEALLKLRNETALSPQKICNTDKASRRLCLSEGYFRAVYKDCFGISYANDCINARITLAKYLLCTTSMSIYAIAMRCGYTDEKFFARQFRQHTGYSPIKYRNGQREMKSAPPNARKD